MHKRLILALPVLALTGLLAGCGAGSNSGNTANNNGTTMNATSAPAAGTVLVTVNGHPITASEVNAFVALRTHGRKIHLNAMQRHQVAEQMIQFNLMYQAALKEGLQNNPDVRQSLALQKKLFLASQAVQHYMDTAQVPDSKLQAEYKKLAAKEGGEQYKARHILVKQKSEAEKIIKELDNGADFAKLAKKDSIDKASAKQGGELGWFKPKQMVAPFSAAVEKLKKGHYTEKPVKSQFGWHVILLQDERTSTPPSFTSSKPMLAKQARNSMLRDHIETLQNQADIKWKVPNPASAIAAKRAAIIRHAQQAAAAQSASAVATTAVPATAPVPATH